MAPTRLSVRLSEITLVKLTATVLDINSEIRSERSRGTIRPAFRHYVFLIELGPASRPTFPPASFTTELHLRASPPSFTTELFTEPIPKSRTRNASARFSSSQTVDYDSGCGTGDILPLFEALRSDVFNFPPVCLKDGAGECKL